MPYKEKALKYGNIMWDRECKEILKSDPDYSLVISVIRGHSLVEIFKNDSDSPSSTKEWIKNTDFRYIHSEVGKTYWTYL